MVSYQEKSFPSQYLFVAIHNKDHSVVTISQPSAL